MTDASATTERIHSGLIPYKPGQSGNPNGRPKGARNRLSEAFLEALEDAWHVKGQEVIDKVIQDRPHEFLKVIAGLLPKDVRLNVSEYADLSDEQLLMQLQKIYELIGPAISAESSRLIEGVSTQEKEPSAP